MINRCYFFSFNYFKDGVAKYIQFTATGKSFFPKPEIVWNLALSRAKEISGANEVECTKFERVD